MGRKRSITPDMAGTWLDGAHGWHNHYRALDLAWGLGWKPEYPWHIRQAVKLYKTGDHNATIKYNKGRDTFTYEEVSDWIMDQGGLVDQAIDHLNTKAPDGYYFAWNDGDFGLWSSNDLEE